MNEIKDKHQIDLCLADSNNTRVKKIEFSPKRELKINPTLSLHQQEELCNMLRDNLDSFASNFKVMKGVHPWCELIIFTSRKVVN